MNNYVENRKEIKELLFNKLFEEAINTITNEKISDAFEELEFFNDTIKKDPLNFSLASIKFMDAILENDYIKTYNFDSFVKEYTKLIVEDLDNVAYMENFNFELDSISESMKYYFSKTIPERVLTEETNGINNEDVKDAFKKKIKEALDEANTLRDTLKYYKEGVINKIKPNTPEKKEVLNTIIKFYDSASVGIDKFISFINSFNNKINIDNGSYFTDKTNKDDFYKNFNSFQSNIALLGVCVININVLFNNIDKNNIQKIPTTRELYTTNNTRPLWALIKALNPISNIRNESEYFSSTTAFIDKSSELSYRPILNYFYNVDENLVITQDISNNISREQSLSFKFVHHLDQLLRDSINLNKALKRLIDTTKYKDIDQLLSGYDITNIANRMTEFISSSNKFYKDLEIMVISGHNDLITKYKANISL